jgi:biopolymer transport protein ExbB/TolQ
MNAFADVPAAVTSVLQHCGIWGVPLGLLLWAGLTLCCLRFLVRARCSREDRALAAARGDLLGLCERLVADVGNGLATAAGARNQALRHLLRVGVDLRPRRGQRGDQVAAVDLVSPDARASQLDRLQVLVMELAPLVGLVATSAGYCELLHSASLAESPSFADLAGPASKVPIATMIGLGIALLCMPAMALVRLDVDRQQRRELVAKLTADHAEFEAQLVRAAASVPPAEVMP